MVELNISVEKAYHAFVKNIRSVLDGAIMWIIIQLESSLQFERL